MRDFPILTLSRPHLAGIPCCIRWLRLLTRGTLPLTHKMYKMITYLIISIIKTSIEFFVLAGGLAWRSRASCCLWSPAPTGFTLPRCRPERHTGCRPPDRQASPTECPQPMPLSHCSLQQGTCPPVVLQWRVRVSASCCQDFGIDPCSFSARLP